ncbi:aminotransferase class V-fold PLP-dependent enzyme [bacterium]|nr:aminotransferase class V-fold PLP-dependent enzyme [candidate division CSSED10-310 bacterium]
MNLYFDNAATTWPKPDSVYTAVDDCLRHLLGNPSRSSGGEQGAKLIYRVRKRLASLFNISNPLNIIMTCNATTAINIALQGFLKPHDRVITTSMEHNAVCRPLRALERLRSLQIVIVKASPAGFIDPADIQAALNTPARLIVINHASNICGSFQDLETIGHIAKSHDTVFMVDASQSAGIIPIDVQKEYIDVLAAPGHKSLLGPTGTGFCYVSPDLEIEPLIYGGTGSQSELDTQPVTLPDRFESGTLNFHGIAGLKAGLEFIQTQNNHQLLSRERDIVRRVLDGFKTIKHLNMHGPQDEYHRLPVFSITAGDTDPSDLANLLEEIYNINTRVGLHCAPWAHKTLGTFPQGTVRISPGIFHTDAELDVMIDSVDKAVSQLCR